MKAKSITALTLALFVTVTTCFSLSTSAEEEITVPVTYDPISILNTAAGNYGIGGSSFTAGSTGTAVFNDVFSLKAEGTQTLTPDSTELTEVAVVDVTYNNTIQFRSDALTAPRAWVEIFEYESGKPATRALWWSCGETWYYQSPVLVFTAPVSGKYDISANEGFTKVKMTPSAVRDCVPAYKDSKVTFEIMKGETVLGSAAVSVSDSEKDFPNVTGVELVAGETIAFRVTAPAEFANGCWYGTNIEAVPMITLTEINKANVAPTLSVSPADTVTLVDQAVTLNLDAKDPNGDKITVTQSVEAAHGKVTVDLDAGTATYTPDKGYVGDDTFTLKANDGELDSEALTIHIKVCKSISAAVADIKANMEYFYEEPQGLDWLDIDQTLCNWQWQVAYDGLLGTNAQGWRVAEMAMWNQWGIALAHTDSPSMHITENDQLLLNCDKPFGLNAKGGLTFVAPEDGLYLLTHTDVMETLGLDEWRVNTPDQVPAGDRYTTPVYVSITKDNKIVWPANGQPLKLDPNDPENISVDFPDVETAMKKGDSLRIVVEMDDTCKSWMNRIFCDPVVYNIGNYDAAKDLNVVGGETGDNTEDNGDSGNEENQDKPNPGTGFVFPISMIAMGAMSLAAAVATKKRK